MDPKSSEKKGLMSLPVELLILILEPFPTRALLPTRAVSRCWYDLVVRIIHDRLALAMPSKDHILILESYHPSTKSIEPPLFCHYIRTPGLSHDGRNLHGSRSESSITQLRSLYSHFRPVRQAPSSKQVRSHPAGEVPGSRTSDLATSSSGGAAQDASPSHSINLEPYELFSQLCVAIHRAQVDQRGIIYSIVNVTDSVVRIFRQWLAQRARSCDENHVAASSPDTENIPDEDRGNGGENDDDGNMLWVDDRKHVGIRVRVKENVWKRNAPILQLKDEDPAVSYTLEHEELLVRTTCLLQAAEQALMEQDNISGKAMILGPFT